jgi:hypothetical protein
VEQESSRVDCRKIWNPTEEACPKCKEYGVREYFEIPCPVHGMSCLLKHFRITCWECCHTWEK